MSGEDSGPDVIVTREDPDDLFDDWEDEDDLNDLGIDDEPDHDHEDRYYNDEVKAAYEEKPSKQHIFNIQDLDL